MRRALVPALALVAALLAAPAAAGPASRDPASVVGGRSAPAGKWPDVAAVFVRGRHECTGTLIAPTVVITAGHCKSAGLDSVLVGASNLARRDGEEIRVIEQIEYPESWSNFDVALLILEKPASAAPRALATGWARADIVDAAAVQVVGFGATDRDGTVFIDDLQEGETTITDADCSTPDLGCNASAQPEGELGAGGDGVDTCVGDSGGPLYLVTPYGVFLAGITSRAYLNAEFPCAGGGIYTRADKIVDWIESETGIEVAGGPTPELSLRAEDGTSAVGTVAANDPRGERPYVFAIESQPAHGTALVRGTGEVVYTPRGDYVGDDPFTVRITDTSSPDRSIVFEVDAESTEGGGLCAASRSPAGLAPLALVGLAMVLRRRARR
jgi:secreted trypsin-like serine protease